jgi:nucleotide-binding universal stress UspA family protein
MFDHILIPLDGSSLAECVLPHTVALARALGAHVTLLRVLEPAYAGHLVDQLDWQIRKTEVETYLEEVTARLRKAGLKAERALLEGQAADHIVQFARNHNVDLIVLGSHGRSGLSGWNVSSVVQKVILRAYVPIMIIRAYQPVTGKLTEMTYRRIFVPLDGSQRAECVLPLVTNLALFYKSQLLATHVVSRPEMPRRTPLTQEEIKLSDQIISCNQRNADDYLEQIRSQLSSQAIDVQTRLIVSDDMIAELHELAEQEKADLVVLSAHGYSCKSKWPYGSLAISFITYGTSPLIVVQDVAPEEVQPTQAEIAAREHKGH